MRLFLYSHIGSIKIEFHISNTLPTDLGILSMSDVAESATASNASTVPAVKVNKMNKKEQLSLQSKDGSTAFHITSKANSHALIEVLIWHGADMNIPDNTGSTPLITNIKFKDQTPIQVCLTHENPNLNIFKSLLKYSPSIKESDIDLNVIKDIKVRETFQQVWNEFKQTIIDYTARELKEQGLDLPYNNSSTNSVLHNFVEHSGVYVNNVQYEDLKMPEYVAKAKATVAEQKKQKEEEAKSAVVEVD